MIDKLKKGTVFGILASSLVYGAPMRVNQLKNMLKVFNSRPDNVYGQHIRIMVGDSGFKEGIDLFDVKYVHLYEPQLTKADETQAIGRATRFCGQKGLHFVPNKGWQLDVFTYKSYSKGLPMEKLYHVYAGTDLSQVALKEQLEKLAIETAVDRDLNAHILNKNSKKATSFMKMKKLLGYKSQLGGAKCTYTCSTKEVGKRKQNYFLIRWLI